MVSRVVTCDCLEHIESDAVGPVQVQAVQGREQQQPHHLGGCVYVCEYVCVSMCVCGAVIGNRATSSRRV
jgi:hypothetical protein